MSDVITGKTLIAWGYRPGPWFAQAIAAAEAARRSGAGDAELRSLVERFVPPPAIPLRDPGGLAHRLNITAEDADEAANVAAVERHMVELMRVPTIRAGAVMPDACPAGSAPGTIPVGGVVAAENAIHPGMHSADICCSMALTVLGDVEPARVLDAGMQLSHFGGGGRSAGRRIDPPAALLARFDANPFLKPIIPAASEHFATQGDGNHFFAENGLGFAPHGAGRNFSRTAFLRRHAGKTEEQLVAEQTAGIDARFFCGIPDVSELPGAYKDAASMRRQIDAFGLAEIVDLIEPLGSIMAGDWQRSFRGRSRPRPASE